jgi:hypothetical protein
VAKGEWPGGKIPHGCVKFKVGDLVRITKEKVKFAKWYEQTFLTEIFRAFEVIQHMPHLFTNSLTCRIVLSMVSFTIMSWSRSLYHPELSSK